MQLNSKTHPLIITAAVAVIITSAVALASMTGLIGKPQAEAPPVVQAPVVTGAEGSSPAGDASTQNNKATTAPKAASKPPAVAHHNTPPREQPRVQTSDDPSYLPQTPAQAPVQVTSAAPICRDCGRIASVRELQKKADGSGLGAIAGGVAGALLGNQVGGGNGKTVMTVLGAAGGAYAGNQVEKTVRSTKGYEVNVQFDDGTTRSFSYDTLPAWQAGDRIRVVNGQLQGE